MELKKVFHFISALSILVVFSCKNDDLESVNNNLSEELDNIKEINEILSLKNVINEAKISDVLITLLTSEGEFTTIEFEDGNIYKTPKDILIDYKIDKATWSLELFFSDSSAITTDILGESSIQESTIIQDPFDIVPLSAIIDIKTPIKGKYKVTVKGQDGVNSDIIIKSEYFGKEHSIEIFGLYADYTNTIILSFTNENGIERTSEEINITTEELPFGLPTFDIVKQYEDFDNNTLILVNYRPTHIPFMVDPYGKIRWYSEGFTTTGKYALQQFKNGNLGFGKAGNGQGSVFEYTMMGELVNEYSFYPEFENAHHDVYEMPNGNFLISVNKVGADTVEDHIIAMDRNNGDIINIWDLGKILPIDRFTLRKIRDGSDWFHNNAVIYDEKDNSIIVSGQAQGLAKITWDNQLKWILAPHEGWSDEFTDYLLKPFGGEFEWSWGQHAPLILPNNNLLLFDNGFGRNFGNVDSNYSRIVEYLITENDNNIGGSITQEWQYGKERGDDMFSSFVSDVDYINESSTRFIVAGSTAFDHFYNSNINNGSVPNIDQVETRIIEINDAKDVLFEMTLKSNEHTGTTFRAEKLILN